jgi:hypothetical protein
MHILIPLFQLKVHKHSSCLVAEERTKTMTPEQIEQQLIAVGEALGLDSRCSVNDIETDALYEDADGNQHVFNFATDPSVDFDS